MTDEELKALFEKHSGEFLKFDRVPEADRSHPSKDLCAFLKIASLMTKPDEFCIGGARHDLIWLAQACHMPSITEADVVYLSRCGIHYDSDNECLAQFC